MGSWQHKSLEFKMRMHLQENGHESELKIKTEESLAHLLGRVYFWKVLQYLFHTIIYKPFHNDLSQSIGKTLFIHLFDLL